MNSSSESMRFSVLDRIHKHVTNYLNKTDDYEAKLDLIIEAKELYKKKFRENVIWVLGKHGRSKFYTYDYLEILERIKKQIDNEILKNIIVEQQREINKKINDIRDKFSEIEKKMLEKLSLTQETKADEIRIKIKEIRENESDTSNAYSQIFKLGKELLKNKKDEDIKDKDIEEFANSNFRNCSSDFIDLDTAKDTLALLFLHYILGKVPEDVKDDDAFYLIEDALYTRQIPLN